LLREIRKNQSSLENLGLWTSFLLLFAEGAMLLGDLPKAEKIFSSLLGDTPSSKDLNYLQAHLGMVRIQGRQKTLDPSFPSLKEAMALLSLASGPYFSAWRIVLGFISQDPDNLRQSHFKEALECMQKLESPELLLELSELLGIYLKNNCLEGLFG